MRARTAPSHSVRQRPKVCARRPPKLLPLERPLTIEAAPVPGTEKCCDWLPRQQVKGLLESPRKPAEPVTYGGGGRNGRKALNRPGRANFRGRFRPYRKE